MFDKVLDISSLPRFLMKHSVCMYASQSYLRCADDLRRSLDRLLVGKGLLSTAEDNDANDDANDDAAANDRANDETDLSSAVHATHLSSSLSHSNVVELR